MTGLPFGIVDAGAEQPVVLLGLDEGGLVGFDPVDLHIWEFDASDVSTLVSIDPVAIYSGVSVAWSAQSAAVANRAAKRWPKFAARGERFPLLPAGVVSGFPMASSTLRKHREELPSVDAIRVSALFAVSTVRTSIKEAERSYECFGQLYRARARQMPPVTEIASCFRGLQNSKSRMFADVAEYAAVIRSMLVAGYRDRELRSVLALDSDLPTGLGLAKLSFTLALLGQDCVCLDARLLGTMFRPADRVQFEQATKKESGRVTERALLTYEAAEDAFLAGNPYYDAQDPLGRARAQWLSWEGVGRKGATHSVWLRLLEAS